MRLFLQRYGFFVSKVCFLSVCAFGGPQAHYVLFQRVFIDIPKPVLSKNTFQDIFSLCQLLPGPSSTQLLTLIAYQKGGMRLALLTLLIWLFPACLIMGICSFLLPYARSQGVEYQDFFVFVTTYVVALLLHQALLYLKAHIEKWQDLVLVLCLSLLFFWFYHFAWIFMIVLALCMLRSFVRPKGLQRVSEMPSSKRIHKRLLVIFVSIFLILGVLSEQARIRDWQYKKYCNLLENTYRYGATVFGGGSVLSSMLYEQYAVRQQKRYVQKRDAVLGMALSQVTPGPVFAYATFIGGLIFDKESISEQILGCVLATLGIFAPGFFIAIFCFQIWSYLQKYTFISRILQAIHWSVAATLLGTFVYLFKDQIVYQPSLLLLASQLFYMLVLLFVLHKKLLSVPLLFALSLGLGVVYHYA